jgi:hypothetical protein
MHLFNKRGLALNFYSFSPSLGGRGDAKKWVPIPVFSVRRFMEDWSPFTEVREGQVGDSKIEPTEPINKRRSND